MSKAVRSQNSISNDKLRKTKICYFFQQGRCSRGSACGFAHCDEELSNQPDLSKTSICLAWKSGGCPHSSANCRFAHGKHDLRIAAADSKVGKPKDEVQMSAFVARPPGLQTPVLSSTSPLNLPTTSPCATFQKSAEDEPMKVKSRSFVDPVFEPMKIMPPPLLGSSAAAQWLSETETVGGFPESSSDGSMSADAEDVVVSGPITKSKNITKPIARTKQEECRIWEPVSDAEAQARLDFLAAETVASSSAFEFSMFGAAQPTALWGDGTGTDWLSSVEAQQDPSYFNEYMNFSSMPSLW